MTDIVMPPWMWNDLALLFIIILLAFRRDRTPEEQFYEEYDSGEDWADPPNRAADSLWVNHPRHPSEFKATNIPDFLRKDYVPKATDGKEFP